MPAFIAGTLFALEEGTFAYAFVYAISALALSIGLNKLSQALAGSQKPSSGSQQNQSREVTIRGTVVARQAIYGEVRSGGYLAYANLTNTLNDRLVYVVVWAAHQCTSVTEYQVDNVRIRRSDLSGGGPLYTVTHAHFNAGGTSYLTIEEHLGTSTQTVSTDLSALDFAWDNTHKGKGICYSIFTFRFNETIYSNGAPQNVFAVVKGRKLYDPRLDSTNGGSGSHRANDATTWAWSNNAALVVRDFISGGSITYDIATPNKTFLGGGELDARIDDSYTIAAANHCDELCTTPIPCLSGTLTWSNGQATILGIGTQFTYEFPGGTIKLLGPDNNFYTLNTVTDDTHLSLTGNFTGTTTLNATTQWNTAASTTLTEARFTADYICSLDATRFTILTALNSAMIGHVSYTGGKYRIFAGVYDSPSITLTADDILGSMDTITSPNDEDLYNSVGGTFYDEQRGWQQQSFPNQTQSSYQTDDGELLPRNIDLLATRGFNRAQRIGNVHLLQSRNKITINFSKLSAKAAQIGEWETFSLTLPEFGYVAQVFRCIEWSFLADGFISINARIEGSALYADLASGSYQLPRNITPAANLSQLPTAPTGLTIKPMPGSIWFTVAGTFAPGTILELWEHTSSSPFSSASKIAEGSSTAFTINKDDSVLRFYWVRARLNGQVSATFPVSTGQGGQAALSSFVARGNCVVSGSKIQKIGGTTAWDSDCYSINGYTACHVQFKSNDTAMHLMIGLNRDPTTDQSYTSIDYAWYCNLGGALQIYEGGNLIASFGTYTPTTVLAITYDGTNFRYFKDDMTTPVRTHSDPGLTMFMDSSFFTPGGNATITSYGPSTNLAVIDTPQIGANAATVIFVSEIDSTVTVGVGAHQTYQYLTITPTADCELQYTYSYDSRLNSAGGLPGGVYGLVVAYVSTTLGFAGPILSTLQHQTDFDDFSAHSQQGSISASAGVTYYVQIGLGDSTYTMDIQGSMLRVELIKR